MRLIFKLAAAAAMFVSAAPAFAQELIVTGQRRAGYSGDTNEPVRTVIALRRTADYFALRVSVTNDTRDAKARQDEIHAMLKNAVDLAPKHGIELSTGTYLVQPLSVATYRTLPLSSGSKVDTSIGTFLAKVKLAPGMDHKTAMDRITKFVAAVPKAGRAQMSAGAEMMLSVVNPDQYRGQIIDLIAADAKTTTTRFGPGYGVDVGGLDRPVEWARASETEVFLYLPSTYTVRSPK